MNKCFQGADFLLPKNKGFEKWAVIACDQFTSDRAYWTRVDELVGQAPSALRLVLPEIYLEEEGAANRVESISQYMARYENEGVFEDFHNAFVYVERTLLNGSVRCGIVGMVDLEQYHYDPSYKPAIGATEQTVLERIPPRLAVRAKADLEFPHVILFCNDKENHIIKPVTDMKESLPKLYDFDLMEGGGHIRGWLVAGEHAQRLQSCIDTYLDTAQGSALLVADGNHSLVTAKSWYEELKKQNPGKDLSAHPARFALVELENILDDAINFEPIHRVIFDTDPEKLLNDLNAICGASGTAIEWIIGEKKGTANILVPDGELPAAVLQRFLDQWLKENPGRIDYIHDADAIEAFAGEPRAIGLMLPVFDKSELFAFGAAGKILPRKTFSLGHGREKRYYLEGRRIK